MIIKYIQFYKERNDEINFYTVHFSIFKSNQMADHNESEQERLNREADERMAKGKDEDLDI